MHPRSTIVAHDLSEVCLQFLDEVTTRLFRGERARHAFLQDGPYDHRPQGFWLDRPVEHGIDPPMYGGLFELSVSVARDQNDRCIRLHASTVRHELQAIKTGQHKITVDSIKRHGSNIPKSGLSGQRIRDTKRRLQS